MGSSSIQKATIWERHQANGNSIVISRAESLLSLSFRASNNIAPSTASNIIGLAIRSNVCVISNFALDDSGHRSLAIQRPCTQCGHPAEFGIQLLTASEGVVTGPCEGDDAYDYASAVLIHGERSHVGPVFSHSDLIASSQQLISLMALPFVSRQLFRRANNLSCHHRHGHHRLALHSPGYGAGQPMALGR